MHIESASKAEQTEDCSVVVALSARRIKPSENAIVSVPNCPICAYLYIRIENNLSFSVGSTVDYDMAKTKTISKGCPKCEQQVPVACKACPCGHSFFNARRNSIKSPPSPDNGVMKTRRTNRIKREKPNYYDALEYDKQTKKSAKIRRTTDAANDIDCRQLNKKKKRKGKGKGKNGSSSGVGDDDDEMEGINGLSPEKQLTCSLILQELNNKMRVVAWKPT